MIINSTNNQTGVSPFGPFRSSDTSSSTGTSFESQLSTALAESLQKLGLKTGEVNITIRNPSSSTRQIMVTYSVDPASADSSTSGATASDPTETPTKFSSWAPYTAAKDTRDALPEGGGLTTKSGAPLIELSEQPASNQYGYTGPAARNPYFSTPSNPLREGYVLGFQNWFQEASIVGGPSGPLPANKIFYATEEGAQEALRIVEQFSPGAKIVKSDWQSGPYAVNKPTYNIDLGDGRLLNAGGVLNAYYSQGQGVTTYSDEIIRREIQLA